MKTGAITMYGGATAPADWLLCDGSAVSRTTYESLFEAIGTTYGAGDGSTTFNVPDMRSRIPRSDTRGATGGAEAHALSESELPSHTHSTAARQGQTPSYWGNAPYAFEYQARNYTVTYNNDNAGSGTAHQNMPPFIALNYIIKT